MVTVGQVVAGRYRIVRPLAAGGMGRVWLAADETNEEPVALKRCDLPDGLTPDEQDLFRVWTVREARAFALVGHPNVIRTRDVLPDDDAPWIVMEYVPSRSLQQIIDESGPLPPARVAGIGLAVLAGLLAIRRAGLLHLDVKPSNVLIADDGRVVLTDFGPAVTVEGVRALAGAGIILGSPKYLAPERLADGGASPESDLWSLGATLYHAVEGRPPYSHPTTVGMLLALTDGPPDPPRQAGPLTPVLAGLLRHDPAARSAPDRVEDQLRRVVGQPATARALPRAVTDLVRPSSRGWLAALATLVGVLAALVTLILLARPDDPSEARLANPPPAPAGHLRYEQANHYRLLVPDGWPRRGDGRNGLVVTGPAGEPVLRVTVWPTPPDVMGALTEQERDTDLPGYRRGRIERLPDSRDAIWEYSYDDPRAGPTRGSQRVFHAGSVSYAVDWRAPRDAWVQHLPELTTVVGSFTPLGAR